MDWIVWNRETLSITDFGRGFDMCQVAETLNRIYQTDAYVAKQYIPHD
jgi:hypothetical protein